MGPPRRFERGKFQQCLRADADRGRALAQLDGAVAPGAQRGGQLEHGAGAQRGARRRGSSMCTSPLMLATTMSPESSGECGRRSAQRRQRQRQRQQRPNYTAHGRMIMVSEGHRRSPSSNAAHTY